MTTHRVLGLMALRLGAPPCADIAVQMLVMAGLSAGLAIGTKPMKCFPHSP